MAKGKREKRMRKRSRKVAGRKGTRTRASERSVKLDDIVQELVAHATDACMISQEEVYSYLEEAAPEVIQDEELYYELLQKLESRGVSVEDSDEDKQEEETETEELQLETEDIEKVLAFFPKATTKYDRSSAEVVQKYLKVISRTPLLTPEEEVELIKRIKQGDENARERFVMSNLALVISIARKYYVRRARNLKISFDELIQEGIIGLLKALDRFDLSKGTKFSTYATWWIRQHIAKYIQDNLRIGTIPASFQEMLQKYARVVAELRAAKGGINPTIDEIIDKMYPNLKEEVLEELNAERTVKLTENDDEFKIRYQNRRAQLEKKLSNLSVLLELKEISINEKKYDDSSSSTEEFIKDDLESPEEVAERKLKKDMLLSSLSQVLTEQERNILIDRYGLIDGRPRTLEELATKFGLSRERIRQLEERAIRKLKASEIIKRLSDMF